MKKNSRIHNQDIPRAVRDWAAHGGTAGRVGDGQDGTPTGRFAEEITIPLNFQTNEEYPPGRVSGSAVDPRFITGTTAALRSWLLGQCTGAYLLL